MNNITRTKRNAEIVTGKILVTCKVTIDGLGTHSGTGEEWGDEDNAMTSAEAQAFKRACSCFGLGRYFYDFDHVLAKACDYTLGCGRGSSVFCSTPS